MVALERKFDELLSFVQLIAKRNTEDENQRKEDDKDTNEREPEGHSNTNVTPPRPPTPPKPEGKDSQLDSKIDSLEEKIRLIQGLNSFGNTDFSSMSWFPNMTVPPKFKAPEFEKYNGRGDPMIHLQMYCRKMAPYADNEPLLIQTFQDTLTGNAAEWYSQLKKISHWKELADTFLAQYGFNSQIAPDRFDLQRMEKKSNETFREYAQRWREKAARARPPLDEREMIKIFVDTLKNPYFDRMMGLQMQFFVDLIPVGERIEDALKTKKIVDMTALMALAEQAAKKAPTKRKEGDVQMIGRSNGRPRQILPTFTMQPIQPRPMQAPAPAQVPAPALAPQVPARPVGNQPNDNRWPRKELRQFTPLPMPLTELYPILIEKSLISPVVPRPYNGPQRRDFNPNSTCDFHFGEVGHTVENCGQLKHRVQDLIDHGVLKFEGLPNITTNPLPNHPEGGVNMVEIEEGNEERIAWRRLFYTLEKRKTHHPVRCTTGAINRGLHKKIPSKRSRQPDDPSEFDWYAEINLDDIVEDEMDLDNLQDEEADWGYFMEDDTDEWRDVDFTEFFQFPCLIVPPGFVTPEFEIFYEDGDPEVHLQKYGEKMALHLENELLMISVFPESLSKQAAAWFYQLRNLTGWDDLVRVFLERYRFNPHSILEYLGLKKDEEPYIIPDPGVSKAIVEIKEESDMSSLPALAEGGEEEKDKLPPPAKEPSNIITTAVAEEEDAGPMVEGLSIHTITEEEDSTTTPPTRHCQQGEEAKTWTCVPLLQRISSSNEITRETSNDPHVSKIDNETDCSLDNIDNSDEEIELPSDILEALERQDEGSKPNIEELEIVNLANEGEEPREVKIGTRCAAEQKEALIALLREFHEIFAWSYQDMPGLDTDIVVHKIPAEARMQARQASTAPNEARSHFEDQGRGGKAIEGRFPKHSNLFGLGSQYSPGAERRTEKSESTNVVFSFMDGFSGYNQIKMAEEDKSKTAFVTHWGTFVYDVMPFGLKNAGATYQRAMVTLFHDMIHHEIEVYVDDMIAKSRTAQDHLTDLRKLFQRLKKYQLRLNPNKCAFGVTSGKLLGFIVSGRGIEIDPAKLTATCEPLFKLLRKDVKIKWTEDCQKAFDKIKEYLLNPPILVPPTPGRPLILYLTVQEASMGCMLGQQDETGKKEQAIYYLSKKFTEPETRYLLVEKTCCALAWASKKLRQYMLYYTTWLVSRMDPIKYIFEKPALTGKIARWQVLLSEFDILFVARKAIKGQAIADYLADYPSEQLELMDSEFPDEDVMTVDEDNQGRWKLYFDGAANAVGSGIGAVLVSPKGQQTPIAVKLGFDCTNNMTEYEACIVGLQAALEFGAYELEVFGDSLLIVSQTNGEWQGPGSQAHPVSTIHQPANPKVQLVEGDDVRPLRIETRDIPAYCVCIEECMNVEAEIDDKPWYYDIKRFIQDREYPSRATENEKKYIRRMAFQFFLSGEILYKRTHDATLLRCVDAEEANRLIREMHAGLMGAHANGPFPGPEDYESWLLLVDNGEGLHQTSWGMDVIGAITPKASNGHEFILVAIDYFTKWVEACSFKNVTQVAVTRFVKNNIICRYGMPEMLITDNASNLNNRMMDQLCQQFKIQHHNSAPYRPKMNGAVEAANKNVKKILSKMTETYKDWHEHLPYALCAYRTSVRTSVGATPYSLVYGMEAVLPVEVEIPSLRILSQTQLEEAEWAQARYEQLNFIDEKRLAALCHGQLYQRRIERAYNKKARPRTFQPGDLVLKKRNMALSDPRGKFAPSYEGPYVVKKAFSGGAIILADMDGEEFRSPINSDSVIKYHV
uniref:Integrase catalytic domain-containing protein n=1 Tax=Fagus sylvatica TaxID=28930 RepID=A0A2N9HPB0_FAGSY